MNPSNTTRTWATRIATTSLLLLGLAWSPDLSYAMPAAATIDQFGAKSSWPSESDWRPIASLNDPIDSGLPGEIDFVGDASNPTAYYFSDSNYWYIRARVHIGSASGSTFHDTILVLIDRNADYQPENSFSWDSKSGDVYKHGLELQIPGLVRPSWAETQMDDNDGASGQKLAGDFQVPTDGTTGDGYLRTIDGQATTNFGSTTFVDIAASWSFLEAKTSLRRTDTWKIQLGSIADSTDHNAIRGDVAGNHNPTDPGLSFGDLLSPTAVVLSSLAASNRAPENVIPISLLINGIVFKIGQAFRGHLDETALPQPGLECPAAGIIVSWKTRIEVRTAGFNIYRSTRPGDGYDRINKNLIPASLDPLLGGSYTFLDTDVSPSTTYYYLLEDIEFSGASVRHGPLTSTTADGSAPGNAILALLHIARCYAERFFSLVK